MIATTTTYITTIIKLLFFIISFLHASYALTSDGFTLLSLLRTWTFVPPLINSTWRASDSNPCSSWHGVQCDHNNRVVSLNLTSLGIFGQLGPQIGNLYHLHTLLLLDNGFSGKVPSELSNCSLLENLDLSGNRFSGNIPYSLNKLQDLRFISLSSNLLTGEIPDSLFETTSLEEVSFHSNLLSGSIPTNIGNLTQLLRLYLYGNQLSGTIPSSIGNCSKLQDLDLSFNSLRGEIPVSIWRIQTLSRLFLNKNNFNGSLPEFESNLNLNYVEMSNNNISGLIPSSLGNCTNVTYINLSWNKFGGLIPSDLGNLVNLVTLNLAHNNLEGSLPLRLSNCTKMDRFDVGFNLLNGSIPSSLRSWRGLTALIVRENHFTGGIPLFLAEFSNLRELQLGGNSFGGEIPRSMGALRNLFFGLNLSGNGLTGGVPAEIGKLKLLQSLDISFNNLTGNVDALEGLVSLIALNISYNLFNGSVSTGLNIVMKLLKSSPSSFMGNPLLCINCMSCINSSYVNPCVYKSNDQKRISNVGIVMIALGSSILISAVLVIIIRRCLLRKDSDMESDVNQWYYIDRGAGRIVGYADEFNISAKEQSSALKKLVLQATENLSDEYIIGRGAHGIVYKAILGHQVFAVKQFEFARNKRKQLCMMRKEIEVLGMYKHRNLIRYADYWIGDEYGLVFYKFMENGSLHDILHEKNPPPPLTWNVRFNIAVGIAEGIAYLHNNCNPPIVHRDIKPKNILIDENMEPIIADFGTALFRKSSEDSYSHSETRKMLSTKVIGTPGYIAPENAYQVVQGRKSDVYSYGVVLLELITRQKVLVTEGRIVTPLVSWARKVWLETGKIEDVADSYLASSLQDSAALTKQVTTMFLLALQCTEKDLRKRPIMKDILGLYRKDMFKQCDEEEYGDTVAGDTVADDISLQESSPNILPNIPVVSIESHLHGESSRAAMEKQRFNAETEPKDYNDLSFWPDIDQFQLGFCVEENWCLKPTVYIDGLLVKLMGNGKIKTEQVLVVAALNVPKVTYVWPSLIFIPSVAGPIVTKPFNWFFLSCWGQYMHLHKSLYYQPISYFINANKINTLQDLILKATENLNDQYVIGRGAHCIVYKVILGQQVFALKKFEFGRKKKKHQSIVSNEIEVLGMFKHRNLIKYTDYWVGDHYALVLYKFMDNGSLHDILHEKNPSPPLLWSDRFKIAVGIARGLAHLHYNCIPPIVHRDIKPKNILLDDNMEPIITGFGTALLCNLSYDSFSHFPSHVIGPQGYTAPANAYDIVAGRKSDVYSYGVVLLELITRKKEIAPSLNDETNSTTLVSWARSVWLETGNIEMIVDSYLASSFPNSARLTKQVAPIFLLALQCTETDLQKRPTMKDVVTTLQPYNPCNFLSDVPDVSADNLLHRESSRATVHRQREVTFNVKPGPRDNNDFMFWQDGDKFSLGIYDWDDWKLMSRPAVSIDGLVIKLMGNCEMEAKTVVVVALIVPKVTYTNPCLIFLPSIIGPTVRELFNWFFLSQWSRYMHQQKSLHYQSKSYFRNVNQIKSLQDLVLVATGKLKEQYSIGRRAHGVVHKAILGEEESLCFLSE